MTQTPAAPPAPCVHCDEPPVEGRETCDRHTAPRHRPPALVTNVSDLSPRMREALLYTVKQEGPHLMAEPTGRALENRGLLTRVGLRYRLTEAGLRARFALVELEAGRSAQVETVQPAPPDLYEAIRAAVPALVDVARYVAQLRRWAGAKSEDSWDEGWHAAFAMVADQLEEHVLRDLAPVLMSEAVRLDADAAQEREG